MFKKIVSLLICALILFSITACSSGPENSGTVTDTDPTTAAQDPDGTTVYYEPDKLPDTLYFGGKKVNILSNANNDSRNLAELTVESLNSEPINDSMYNRERYVEDRLGVEIVNYSDKDVSFSNESMRQLNSGEDTYAIFTTAAHQLAPYVIDGYLTDLYTVDYLDTDMPWWSQKFSAEAEIEDSLYFATGSLSISLMRNMYAVFFNKSIAENYSASISELGDLYAIVNSGDWTFDKFVELGGDIYEDINGDQIADGEDLYGIMYPKNLPLDAIWSGFDLRAFGKDETGWFTMDVTTEKLFSALEKLDNLVHNVKGSASSAKFNQSLNTDCPEMFSSGQFLFMVHWLEIIETPELRNMSADYGILPFPKYDGSQKEYYSYSHDQYRVFSIPVTNNDPDMAGAVLEAMASYSYRETVPTYLDVALKGKYMSDANSRKTIDLVVNGFKLDASWIYLNLSMEYPASYRYMIMNGEKSFSSNHTKAIKKVQLNLKTNKTLYEKNNKKG